jgi:hypothetical protein
MTGHFDERANAVLTDGGDFVVWVEYRKGEEGRFVSSLVTRELPSAFVPSTFQATEIPDFESFGDVPLNIEP